jgi:hypothetical protein
MGNSCQYRGQSETHRVAHLLFARFVANGLFLPRLRSREAQGTEYKMGHSTTTLGKERTGDSDHAGARKGSARNQRSGRARELKTY